jgi:hypothetical protein
MKRFLLLITLVPLQSWAAESYLIDKLMQQSSRYIAPVALRMQMAAENRPDLMRCQADERWHLGPIDSFFAAKRVDLAPGKETYLVFPAKFCPGFSGAHAIQFWVVEKQADGTYRELLSDTVDEVGIEGGRHHGYKDMWTVYGIDEHVRLQYDGQAYR